MRGNTGVLRGFAISSMAIAGLGACSLGAEDGSAPSGSASQQFADLVAAAHAVDPGGSQEMAIREAQAADGMTFDSLNALKYEMYSCFDDAGVTYEDLPPYEAAPGLLAINYTFYTPQGESADAVLALADACQEKFVLYADEAYHRSPVAVDAQDAQRAREEPLIRQCLEDRDVVVGREATYDDLIELSVENTVADEQAGLDRLPCPVEATRGVSEPREN